MPQLAILYTACPPRVGVVTSPSTGNTRWAGLAVDYPPGLVYERIMKKYTIDRSKWLVGGRDRTSCLYDENSGLSCCLGLILQEEGWSTDPELPPGLEQSPASEKALKDNGQ